jgi:hypothetical protein
MNNVVELGRVASRMRCPRQYSPIAVSEQVEVASSGLRGIVCPSHNGNASSAGKST